MKNEAKNANCLVKIYEAIAGMCSETEDPFDHFYRGGTTALMADFEKILTDCGVEVRGPDNNYYVVPYKSNGEELWGICTDPVDPAGSWTLTGFDSSKDACDVLLNKKIFPDFNGRPRILA